MTRKMKVLQVNRKLIKSLSIYMSKYTISLGIPVFQLTKERRIGEEQPTTGGISKHASNRGTNRTHHISSECSTDVERLDCVMLVFRGVPSLKLT